MQWKKAEKPQIIHDALGHPQLRPLIDDWEGREPDPRIRSSLNDKLARLSPDRPFWVAALLFDLYQNPETLPTYCKTAAGQRSEEEASNEIFQEALPHYFRLQKVSTVSNTPKVEKQANLAIRMIASLLSDVQLVSVYLALRMQKLEWPEPLDDEEKQQSAWINLYVDAPLASRIGIFWIKSELEDRAFQILQPEQYADLKRLVARKRDQRRMLVEKTLQEIQKMLQEAGLKHQVQGRYKRFYSIFEKLKRVDDDFEKIHDLT
ncbi:MAG: HD domain-containing protein, partial [SAR324 cluster bacterium]|nr:HD domain-containing protein [SAR324 cluster bacterium]